MGLRFIQALVGFGFGAMAPAHAQSSVREFELAGSAYLLNEQCVRLTPDKPYQTGTAWYPGAVDLKRPFRMALSVVLGDKDAQGADGIVFVFHPNKQVGYRGEGMGFGGLYPSVGVELDTYQNLHLGDPASDHVALVWNGQSDHVVGAPMALGELEDGRRHPLEVTWVPTEGLEVRLDGKVKATAAPNAMRQVFGDASTVYWGMTAATGRLSNAQDVCIETLKLSSVMPAQRPKVR